MALLDNFLGLEGSPFGGYLPLDPNAFNKQTIPKWMQAGPVPGGLGYGTGPALASAAQSTDPLNGDQSGSTPITDAGGMFDYGFPIVSWASPPASEIYKGDTPEAKVARGEAPPAKPRATASPFDNAVPYSPGALPSTVASTLPFSAPTQVAGADVPLPRARPPMSLASSVPLPPERPQIGPTGVNAAGTAGTMGGVPFQIVGGPQTTTLSARTTPTIAPSAPPQPQSATQSPGGSFLQRLSNSLAQHPATLMALGAGFAGAPSFGTGMSRAFAAAVPASQQDIATNMKMQGIGETYKALVAQGVSPQEALAAVYNPDVLKAMIPRLYGKTPSWGVVGHDAFGNPRYGFIDTYDQTVLPAESVTKPRVGSVEDALRLPKGTHFLDPSGVERVR